MIGNIRWMGAIAARAGVTSTPIVPSHPSAWQKSFCISITTNAVLATSSRISQHQRIALFDWMRLACTSGDPFSEQDVKKFMGAVSNLTNKAGASNRFIDAFSIASDADGRGVVTQEYVPPRLVIGTVRYSFLRPGAGRSFLRCHLAVVLIGRMLQADVGSFNPLVASTGLRGRMCCRPGP